MESKEIDKRIDELRDTLNILTSNDYRRNYENILKLSSKLDSLINEYYKLEDN